jgi:hypothetical protein
MFRCGSPASRRPPSYTRSEAGLIPREVALPAQYDFGTRTPSARSRSVGAVLSIVLHLVLGLLILVPLRRDFERVLLIGPNRPGTAGGGGGGSGRVAYITLPAPAASARVSVEVTPPKPTPPVTVTPTAVPPTVIPPPVPEEKSPAVPAPAAPATAAAPDSLAGVGPGTGGGVGGGTGGGIGPGNGAGSGTGNGTGAGEGGTGTPATLRHQVIPPDDAPKQLRGKDIRIICSVDEKGRVLRVEFQPDISDGRYAGRLRSAMMDQRFYPAHDATGRPVASIVEQTVTIY